MQHPCKFQLPRVTSVSFLSFTDLMLSTNTLLTFNILIKPDSPRTQKRCHEKTYLFLLVNTVIRHREFGHMTVSLEEAEIRYYPYELLRLIAGSCPDLRRMGLLHCHGHRPPPHVLELQKIRLSGAHVVASSDGRTVHGRRPIASACRFPDKANAPLMIAH